MLGRVSSAGVDGPLEEGAGPGGRVSVWIVPGRIREPQCNFPGLLSGGPVPEGLGWVWGILT